MTKFSWPRTARISIALLGAAAGLVTADDHKVLQEVLRSKSGAVGQVIAIPGPGKQSLGTGFVTGSGDLLVTNAHVIDGAESVSVYFADGASLGCRLVDQRQDLDLALLQLTDGAAGVPAKRASVVEIDENWKPQKLDQILLISNPNDLNDTPATGTFSNVRKAQEVKSKGGDKIFPSMPDDTDVFQFDVTAAPGSSGGPIFATTGKVVAVLTARHRETTERFVFGVPARNIASLDRKKTPRAFGSESEWRLRPIREGNELSYTRDSARSPIVQSRGVTIDRSSRSLGFIDPNFIGTYLDDPAKISALVPPPQYAMLAQRHRLINVLNVPFRLSFVVPEAFRMMESYDTNSETLTISLTEPNFLQPMTIRVREIDPTPANQLSNRLDMLAGDFVRDTLRVQILGLPLGMPVPPTARPNEVALGPFSDLAPRPRMFPAPAVKFWRHYMAAPQYDSAHLVLYAITSNSFVIVHVPYRPSGASPFMTAPDIVERAFVAGTVSLLP